MFSPPLPHSNLPILFLAAKVSENPTNDDQTCATRAQQLPPHCSLSSLFVGAIWVAHLQLRMQTSTPLQWADRVCMVAWSFTVVLTHALRSCSMSGMEMGRSPVLGQVTELQTFPGAFLGGAAETALLRACLPSSSHQHAC